MLVEFHPSASQELEAASSFDEGRRPGLAQELADEIEDVSLLLDLTADDIHEALRFAAEAVRERVLPLTNS